MKKLIIFSLALLGFLSSYSQDNEYIHDANAQKREASGFHAIHVSGGIDLYLSQGPEAVAVSASHKEDRDRIKTVIVNGVLMIYMEYEYGFNLSWHERKLKAYVSVENLDALEASGGSDVYTRAILKTGKLDLHLSGGSDFKGELNGNELYLHQSGGSEVHIGGSVANLHIEASGGSDFHGYELHTDICDIDASGGSDMQVSVNKELNVSASGGCDIYYKGNAVLHQTSTSGSSSISKKG